MSDTEPRAFTVRETRERLGKMSQEKVYQLINSGELPSFLIGNRRYISASALAGFIAERERADRAARAAEEAQQSA